MGQMSLAIEIAPARRGSDIREKKEALWIKRLQEHPYFHDIVKRIVAGESAQSISRRCEASANKAKDVKNYTYFTWRMYISALRKRVKVTLKTSEIVRVNPTPELVENMIEHLRRDNDIPPAPLPSETEKREIKPRVGRVWNAVLRAIREIDCEKTLKCAVVLQLDHIEEILERQERENKLDENWHKEILVLKDLGDVLRKFEVGEQVLRRGKPYASKNPQGPHTATTSAPAADQSKVNVLPARISKLDSMDRNLVLAATARVIDAIEAGFDYSKPDDAAADFGVEPKSRERNLASNKL